MKKQNPKSPFAQMARRSTFVPRTDPTKARALDRLTRAQDVAAFDRMCANRPLKPPQGGPLPDRVTAGAVEARKARSRGPEIGFTMFTYRGPRGRR